MTKTQQIKPNISYLLCEINVFLELKYIRMKNILYFLIINLVLIANPLQSQGNHNQEFRGVWVATVNNIDWPSEKYLTTDQQKDELIKMLDLYKSLNLNAVIFQIRPSADAFYNSKYEPWSNWLTGTNDKVPNPYYDPLAFAITETHKRGMEFHAWLNPYRAIVDYKEFQSNPNPLTYNKPEWFLNYGKNKYFDPGNPEVRKYTNKVVADIVQQYDVDAIHFDDYFYPYKIENEVFPDSLSFEKFGGKFYPEKVNDWRRDNVNQVIKELHHTIKSVKPWVQFGISPFGVWRNKDVDSKGSDTEAGQTNYDDLYADILLWLENDWLDYILPQVYWNIGHKRAGYKKIVNWWADLEDNTNLYIGHGLYRLDQKKVDRAWRKRKPNEIEKQLVLNNSIPKVKGSVYFSGKVFFNNPMGINEILKEKFYKYPILPPSINKERIFIPEPVFDIDTKKYTNKTIRLTWKSIPENEEKKAVKYLVYFFDKGEMVNTKNNAKLIDITGQNFIDFNKKKYKKGVFVIIAVSRNNNQSNPVYFKR